MRWRTDGPSAASEPSPDSPISFGGTPRRARRGRLPLTLTLLAVLLPAACGGDDHTGSSPDRAEFSTAMTELYGASDDQADCITRYVFDDYDPAEIETIQADGVDALPLGRWDAYFHTVIACLNAPPEPAG